VFQSSQGSQLILIIAALGVIYVLLGVLYESYIHPLTILAGLPSAAVGALMTLRLFNMDLTMIAIIGILMLIGIVKKNAIMMIDFALDAQRNQGMRRRGHPRGLHPALPPDHDDHHGGADGRLADRAGPGRRRRAAPAAGPGRGGRLIFSQVITLYITPVIYLFLDKYSGTGPMLDEDIAADKAIPAVARPRAAGAAESREQALSGNKLI
jgi:HAE1 family hydrophobic/amphiphilic exporter-1